MKEKVKIAWAAGLFEGEGSIVLIQESRDRRPYPRLQLTTTDSDVAYKFKRYIKAGCIYERKRKTVTGKRVFFWVIKCKFEVKRVLKLFMPYFGVRRRKKAKEALKFTKYMIRRWR
jgi:hypothetical protein